MPTGTPTAASNAGGIKQVALLSQKGRAMLHVIEYFAKSLKLTKGDSK